MPIQIQLQQILFLVSLLHEIGISFADALMPDRQISII